MKRYARRKKFKVKKLFILLFTVMLCVMAGKVLHSSLTTPFLGNITHHMASEDHGWNLILVNRENYIPADYEVQLTELSNGKKVDSRIYPELQEMFNAARAQGYGLFVREGYRTQEEQQQLMNEKIEAHENEGKSKSEAKKLAEQWVAIPGTSEHQLGIAVDINADTTKSSRDDVYNWLEENAHTYGFIKRYPSNKTDITGVINEPWHYRYVGKEAASAIYSQGICLEEYIETLE
ncbi:D-alanyl-D-alanine carboxypeptidase family protein [Blautia sp. OM07-19]|uniref:M15 family metallopeptidase n=1 Tax=Blautia sp. OM07-19 TaxID=2292985 RepID=UPI000E47A74F|nr:M15 family metallopeptidase [Blautia sp. OM07-19]RHV00240.1 D-alanyl-D-alanine carboxypeptidase family protein [Blautia sp. OM07-19]